MKEAAHRQTEAVQAMKGAAQVIPGVQVTLLAEVQAAIAVEEAPGVQEVTVEEAHQGAEAAQVQEGKNDNL